MFEFAVLLRQELLRQTSWMADIVLIDPHPFCSWRKRGLSVVPTRWPVALAWANFSAIVTIFAGDATVAIAHGGIEMGQGINTKVMQVRLMRHFSFD